MLRSRPPLSVRWILLLALLSFAGCGDDSGPEMKKGRYRAHIDGHMTGTLTGPAVYRSQKDRLVGIELGTPDGSGLSIEVGPQPLRARTYRVTAAGLLEGQTVDSLAGTLAFLTIREAEFEATEGTLSLTRVGSGELRGTFDFVMEGSTAGGAEPLSVRVTGRLRATPNQEESEGSVR